MVSEVNVKEPTRDRWLYLESVTKCDELEAIANSERE